MKLHAQILLICCIAVGCSTPDKNTSLQTSSPTSGTQPLQKVVTEFKREGISVHYRANGEIEKIEIFGYGKIWQQQYEHIAELDAKEKLTKFLRGESVSSTRKLNVIAKSLEKANDKSTLKSSNYNDDLRVTAEELESNNLRSNDTEFSNSSKDFSTKQAFNNAQIVTTSITLTSTGRLTAVRKISGQIIEDGKTYMATYEWSPQHQNTTKSIINLMDAK